MSQSPLYNADLATVTSIGFLLGFCCRDTKHETRTELYQVNGYNCIFWVTKKKSIHQWLEWGKPWFNSYINGRLHNHHISLATSLTYKKCEHILLATEVGRRTNVMNGLPALPAVAIFRAGYFSVQFYLLWRWAFRHSPLFIAQVRWCNTKVATAAVN